MPMKPKRRPMPPRPPLTVEQILAWADAHHQSTGEWPTTAAGPVLADPNEKWLNIHTVLRLGLRGLPGGDSLARLLERERGVSGSQTRPPLTEEKICRWAEAHCGQTEQWPTEKTGPVEAAAGETWGKTLTPRCGTACAACRAATRWPGCSPAASASASRRGPRG